MKRLLALAALAAAFSQAAPSRVGASSAADLSGAWYGRYFYPELDAQGRPDRRPPVGFRAVLAQSGSSLSGRILEPNTFGRLPAPFLQADVFDGSVGTDGSVRFVKRYDGTGGVGHDVQYEGRISENRRRLAGAWRVRDLSGKFDMTRWP